MPKFEVVFHTTPRPGRTVEEEQGTTPPNDIDRDDVAVTIIADNEKEALNLARAEWEPKFEDADRSIIDTSVQRLL